MERSPETNPRNKQWRRHTKACQANALAEIPPPWQSKVAIIKLCIQIFWLPLLFNRLKNLGFLKWISTALGLSVDANVKF